MENTVRLIQLIHKVALVTLLLLIATIPLIININMVTAFVVLPTFLIFIFTLSIIIDQKLNTLALNKTSIKARKGCTVINYLYKCSVG